MARMKPLEEHGDWRTYQSRVVRDLTERLFGSSLGTYHFQFRCVEGNWYHRVLIDAAGRVTIGCAVSVEENFVRGQRRKAK